MSRAVTDDLTTDLTRVANSFVIARTTAFTYKGKLVDVKQIGRELGVRYVLEGSVRRLGEQVQVNAQLIDAETGAHLWADRFDTDRTNLTKAQNEITSRLARVLSLELAEVVGRRIEQEKPLNLDARDQVMRGWAWFYRPVSAAQQQEAQRAFEQALETDPGSTDARVGLAAVLNEQLALGWSTLREQTMARSDQLLTEVLERDRNNSIARSELGRLRRIQNRLIDSKIELEKAIELDRNNGRSINQLGVTLICLGQPEAALFQLEKSYHLNPRHQNVFYNFYWLGHCHLLLGHVNEAIDWSRRALSANPRVGNHQLAAALGLRGDLGEAKAVLAEAFKIDPNMSSFAQLSLNYPNWNISPQYVPLREKTMDVGLRRAGLPDE